MAVKDLLRGNSNGVGGILPQNFLKFNASKGIFVLRNKDDQQTLGEKVEVLYVDRLSQYKRITKDKTSGKKIVEFSTINRDPRKCTVNNGELAQNVKGFKFTALVFGVLLDSEGPIPVLLELAGSSFASFNEAKIRKGSVAILSKGDYVEDVVSYYTLNVNSRELTQEENNDEVIERLVAEMVEKLSAITE